MTREQALRDYVDTAKLIDQLIEKQQNLKKIILAEVIPTPAIVRKSTFNNRTTKSGMGVSQEKIMKILFDHGGEMSVSDIRALSDGLVDNQIRPALTRLLDKHLIHLRKEREGSKARLWWSSAVHADKDEHKSL